MSELNSQQNEAVHHIEGPMLVLAGAGSGKTRVVTYRIAHLLDMGVLPSDILAVTFTNRAAEEMRTRIRMLKNAHILTCTFHSLGARILRESIGNLGYPNDFTIYDEEDSEKLLKSCLEQLHLDGEKGLLREIRHEISKAKNDLLNPDQVESYPQVFELYQKKLKECQALDFDDLLYLTTKLLLDNEKVRAEYQNRWLFLLIDEYQDTNLAQYNLAKILSAKHRNLFAVGDPDQSIYSWRGARYQNILNFESDFEGAKVVTLDQNYRSNNTILKAANGLIKHNPNRYDKALWSHLGDGSKIGVYIGQTERQEADFVTKQIAKHHQDQRIPLTDIAIFYRTNAQSRIFEDALLSRKIPYVVIGGLSFYQRREIKDMLALLKMVISNTDLISFFRTINIPKRGLGATTLEKIGATAAERGMAIFTFCEELLERGYIKLGAKQAQGLQDYVRLIHHLRGKRPSLSIHQLISEAISESRYLSHLQEDPETFQERKENLDELIGKAAEWERDQTDPSLPKFLEELSLNANAGSEEYIPSIKLMTIHNSKGLEFSVVFLAGLVEDLFPHINSKDNEELLEEERRLCYVGMTRAKAHLYLCASHIRYTWGAEQMMRPSRFLKEIPPEYLQNYSPGFFQNESESDSTEFQPGDRVFHQEFGEGLIQKAYIGSFGQMYEVFFSDRSTTRTLAAKYAKLRVI